MSPPTSSPLTIEKALLGLLRGQPMHGYEMHQRLSDPAGIGLVWNVTQSHVYALLNKLEDRMYVEATIEDQGARPPRKVFHLTERGTNALLEWLRTPVEHGREFRLEFLAKLYFARAENEMFARLLLDRQRNTCRVWLEEQRTEAAGLRTDRPYDWLVRQFRIGQIEAMVAWLDTCEQTLLAEAQA